MTAGRTTEGRPVSRGTCSGADDPLYYTNREEGHISAGKKRGAERCIGGVPFQENDTQTGVRELFERQRGVRTWNSSPIPSASRHVEEFDELASDAVDLLDVFLRACPDWMRSTLERRLTTAPQISSPSSTSSPTRAMAKPRQHWSSNAGLFFIVRTHLPPFAFASSSHIGLIPDLNKW